MAGATEYLVGLLSAGAVGDVEEGLQDLDGALARLPGYERGWSRSDALAQRLLCALVAPSHSQTLLQSGGQHSHASLLDKKRQKVQDSNQVRWSAFSFGLQRPSNSIQDQGGNLEQDGRMCNRP